MRFKSVLGAFLFILMASFFAFIIFIQTKSFGGLVTRVVSDLSQRRLQTEIKIKSFSISVFPPGIELNRIRVKKNFSSEEKLEGEFGKVGIYFSLIELEEKKLTLGEIKISDSTIHYSFPQKNEELKEIDQNLIKKIFRISDELPIGINTIILENAKVHANYDVLEAKRLKLFKQDDAFITRFHLANIRPSDSSEVILDEVWGDAEISLKNIQLYRLKLQHDVNSLLLKGKVLDYYRLKESTVNLNGEAGVYLKSLSNIFPLPEMINFQNGLVRSSFQLAFKNGQFEGSADLYVKDLKSNFAYAEEVRALLVYKNQKADLQELKFNNKDERLVLNGPVTIYDHATGMFLNRPIKGTVKNLKLTNALRILPSLNVIKGELNGDVTFEYKNKDLYFTPKDGFLVNSLALVVGEEKPFTILKIKQAKLSQATFSVIDNEFQMSSSIELPNSKLELAGLVNKNRVQFSAPDSMIDLEDFGNIANLDIKGKGELDLNVSGPLNDTKINLKGQTDNFTILGYNLGKTDKNISIELGQSEVVIKMMEAIYGKTHLSGTGTVNYKNSDIALGISSNDALSSDIVHILNPIFKDLTFLPQDLDFKAKIDADIFGKTKLDDLKVRSKVNFTDLTAYGESFNHGSFDLSLLDQNLKFRNLEIFKSHGKLAGEFSTGLKNKSLGLNLNWVKLDLNSFNIVKRIGLNLNSQISGSLQGSGTLDNYVLKLNGLGQKTRSSSYQFRDSTLDLNITPSRVTGRVDLLGDIAEADLNLSLKHGLASDLKFKFQVDDIKPFLVAVFGQHLENEVITGRTHLEGSTKFQDGFTNLSLTGNLKHLTFHHADFNINYRSETPEFIVEDSRIKKWGLYINEPDFKVSTRGEGIFGKKVTLTEDASFNAKILDILLAPVLSADGFIHNHSKLVGNNTEFDFSIASESSGINLSIEQLPIPINDLKYSINYNDKRLFINELTSSLNNGSATIKGDVFFENQYPDVNLKFLLDKAEFPVLGESILNLTGEGLILGSSPPYNVGGELVINKALILNELNDFSSKSAAFSQVRFLPKNQESILGKLFNLNLNIKAVNPVRVTNSLMDVALKGEVRVTGNPSRPRGSGRVFAPVNTSRIFFKNSEYTITSADINFNPKKEISNPDFDIQAITFISTYKVYPKAYGDLERFNFDLTSDPPLSRNSILSLIAFGYTDEIQGTLESKDQQNLTQVGVGSFVFDRFKISDILNKQFGLQVNLGTVIEQSGTDSLLSGRSQEGGFGQSGGSLGRTRSATKIELKKRLDEALTLSVSSTMGGSIGQRQSMNLTYGLTKKIQLEGVYELRTNAEGQEDIIDNSIGGDLKFRWTFK